MSDTVVLTPITHRLWETFEKLQSGKWNSIHLLTNTEESCIGSEYGYSFGPSEASEQIYLLETLLRRSGSFTWLKTELDDGYRLNVFSKEGVI